MIGKIRNIKEDVNKYSPKWSWFHAGWAKCRAIIDKGSYKNHVQSIVYLEKVLKWRGLDGDGITDPLRNDIIKCLNRVNIPIVQKNTDSQKRESGDYEQIKPI